MENSQKSKHQSESILARIDSEWTFNPNLLKIQFGSILARIENLFRIDPESDSRMVWDTSDFLGMNFNPILLPGKEKQKFKGDKIV